MAVLSYTALKTFCMYSSRQGALLITPARGVEGSNYQSALIALAVAIT